MAAVVGLADDNAEASSNSEPCSSLACSVWDFREIPSPTLSLLEFPIDVKDSDRNLE